jgi:hypothetical protein
MLHDDKATTKSVVENRRIAGWPYLFMGGILSVSKIIAKSAS